MQIGKDKTVRYPKLIEIAICDQHMKTKYRDISRPSFAIYDTTC